MVLRGRSIDEIVPLSFTFITSAFTLAKVGQTRASAVVCHADAKASHHLGMFVANTTVILLCKLSIKYIEKVEI